MIVLHVRSKRVYISWFSLQNKTSRSTKLFNHIHHYILLLTRTISIKSVLKAHGSETSGKTVFCTSCRPGYNDKYA